MLLWINNQSWGGNSNSVSEVESSLLKRTAPTDRKQVQPPTREVLAPFVSSDLKLTQVLFSPRRARCLKSVSLVVCLAKKCRETRCRAGMLILFMFPIICRTREVDSVKSADIFIRSEN